MKGPHWTLMAAAAAVSLSHGADSTFSLQQTPPSSSSVPAAHIICHATVPDLGLLTAARPPPDRPCLSPRFFFFSEHSTDAHTAMKKR